MSSSAEARRPSIDIQERDLQLLLGLFESRVMTVRHLSALYFDGRLEAARKRLQKLKAAGYVRERPRKPTEPSIHFLTRRSFVLLGERGMLENYPRLGLASLEKRVRVSPLTLAHELAVQDVKSALEPALKHAGHVVVTFSAWPLLFEFVAAKPSGEQVCVRPDGFIHVREQDDNGGVFDQYFYLEVDRSSEAQTVLADRAGCYLDHYRRGGLAARLGRPRSEFKQFPFRCLFVFRNAERRNNAAERFLANRPPVLTMAWLTTTAELLANPLAPIWVRPVDCKDAIGGLDYDLAPHGTLHRYRRQTHREQFLEASIKKHTLLACHAERLLPVSRLASTQDHSRIEGYRV